LIVMLPSVGLAGRAQDNNVRVPLIPLGFRHHRFNRSNLKIIHSSWPIMSIDSPANLRMVQRRDAAKSRPVTTDRTATALQCLSPSPNSRVQLHVSNFGNRMARIMERHVTYRPLASSFWGVLGMPWVTDHRTVQSRFGRSEAVGERRCASSCVAP
jgi:hypothetical protein